MADLQKLYTAVLEGDAKTSAAVSQQALDEGVAPMKLVTDVMVPAMDEAGRRFEAEEYFVPELLLAARAMKAAMVLIRPLLVASGAKSADRFRANCAGLHSLRGCKLHVEPARPQSTAFRIRRSTKSGPGRQMSRYSA